MVCSFICLHAFLLYFYWLTKQTLINQSELNVFIPLFDLTTFNKTSDERDEKSK